MDLMQPCQRVLHPGDRRSVSLLSSLFLHCKSGGGQARQPVILPLRKPSFYLPPYTIWVSSCAHMWGRPGGISIGGVIRSNQTRNRSGFSIGELEAMSSLSIPIFRLRGPHLLEPPEMSPRQIVNARVHNFEPSE